jgi:hypothetical protein
MLFFPRPPRIGVDNKHQQHYSTKAAEHDIEKR